MKTKFRFILITALFLISYLNLKAQNMNFYIDKWQQVDSLEQKALPKSALEVVNVILERAKTENNSEQVIKSFIFRLKYKNSNEEKAFEKLCYEMDSAIQTKSAHGPTHCPRQRQSNRRRHCSLSVSAPDPRLCIDKLRIELLGNRNQAACDAHSRAKLRCHTSNSNSTLISTIHGPRR